MIEGEVTLKKIEKLSNISEISNQQIRITACNIFRCPPMVDTRLETFLSCILNKQIYKSIYIHVYGKPKSLHMPDITDIQYMESIVKTTINNVIRKIEYLSQAQDTSTSSTNSKFSKYSDSITIPSILSNWNKSNEECMQINLRPRSNELELNNSSYKIVSPITRVDRTMLIKTKFTNISDTSDKIHGYNLPENHKDYWKYKYIYESIFK